MGWAMHAAKRLLGSRRAISMRGHKPRRRPCQSQSFSSELHQRPISEQHWHALAAVTAASHLDGCLCLLPVPEGHKPVAARAAGGVVPPVGMRATRHRLSSGQHSTGSAQRSHGLSSGRHRMDQLRASVAARGPAPAVCSPHKPSLCFAFRGKHAAHMTRASEQPGQEENAACSMASVTSVRGNSTGWGVS